MGITFGQLRTFLAVADSGSVRAGAERLVVTQPAVSAALANLQSELGVALVAREGRGLVLTPAGVAFAGYARRVLGLMAEAVAAATEHDRPEQGRVRLAAVTTAGERIVPGLLASFRRSYPDCELVLEVGNRRRVWDLLAHHEVDLAIGGRPPAERHFETLATRPYRLVLVAAPDPTVTRGRPGLRQVGIEALAGSTWLLREHGSGTRTTTEDLLHGLDIAPPILTLGSNGAIRESVRAGLGITLISEDAVTDELATGRLREWRHGPVPLAREWHLVARTGETLTPAAGLLVDHVLTTDGPLHFKAQRHGRS